MYHVIAYNGTTARTHINSYADRDTAAEAAEVIYEALDRLDGRGLINEAVSHIAVEHNGEAVYTVHLYPPFQ
jgi:hypothetical protein